MVSSQRETEPLYSIGAVSRATGISTDSIRIWERRYGRPEPVRLKSGHRRYTESQLRWLRRVAEALTLGMRAGAIVPLSAEELDARLGRGQLSPMPVEIQRYVEEVRTMDRPALERSLRQAHQTLGVIEFFDRCLCPLIRTVGQAWADGTLNVRHEHFFTEVCQDVLRSLRLAGWNGRSGPRLLLTALEPEQHALGLQMAGLLCAVHDRYPLILGTSTPTDEVAHAAAELGVRGVIISVSTWTGGTETDRHLQHLRRSLAPDVPIVVGGEGALGPRRSVPGIEYMTDWRAFVDWLETL